MRHLDLTLLIAAFITIKFEYGLALILHSILKNKPFRSPIWLMHLSFLNKTFLYKKQLNKKTNKSKFWNYFSQRTVIFYKRSNLIFMC